MTNFRKITTGKGQMSDAERREKINKASVDLSNALDQCYISRMFLYLLMFWKKDLSITPATPSWQLLDLYR